MKDFHQLSNNFLNVIKSTKNLSDKTIVAYNSDLNDFCNFLSSRRLHKDIILDYTKHLFDERKLQESTITRKLIVLKMFFQFLYQNGHIEHNYYKNYNFKIKKERKLPKTLSIDETTKLITHLSDNTKRDNEIVKLPCGSASISKTFFPCLESPAPKLTAVVVLPTPPF